MPSIATGWSYYKIKLSLTLIFTFSGNSACADWQELGHTADGQYYVDLSINGTTPSSVSDVFFRASQNSTSDFKSSIVRYEVNCAGWLVRILQDRYYDNYNATGYPIEHNISPDTEWMRVLPGGLIDAIAEVTCKDSLPSLWNN